MVHTAFDLDSDLESGFASGMAWRRAKREDPANLRANHHWVLRHRD